ncbi:MAG TPA: DivIVA domain-containing protein [Paenibacillus sp.]|uniref:DivIVA domain-containing protein n=1 Tax=Paenibacillus sp. TaxID=58172 RepID=UPI002B637D65|nr:DivIVA domain-containing protein [Paenibacillus sp.]HUC92659.1 DivIVA domain-containing protein [Paenibacillus sp.]
MSDLQQYGLKFNAQAIHAKEFRKRFFRGYDRMEVDEYLDEIIQDYTRMQEIVERLDEELSGIQREFARSGEEAYDKYMTKRRLEELELAVFGEKRDRLRARV